jgi:hypothetical protein
VGALPSDELDRGRLRFRVPSCATGSVDHEIDCITLAWTKANEGRPLLLKGSSHGHFPSAGETKPQWRLPPPLADGH